jgi:hypothetical protein
MSLNTSPGLTSGGPDLSTVNGGPVCSSSKTRCTEQNKMCYNVTKAGHEASCDCILVMGCINLKPHQQF